MKSGRNVATDTKKERGNRKQEREKQREMRERADRENMYGYVRVRYKLFWYSHVAFTRLLYVALF